VELISLYQNSQYCILSSLICCCDTCVCCILQLEDGFVKENRNVGEGHGGKVI
jgi:hypothetical protein